jgi:hypothetical protein
MKKKIVAYQTKTKGKTPDSLKRVKSMGKARKAGKGTGTGMKAKRMG